LDRGQGVPYKGNYSSWLEQKAKLLQNEKKDNSGRAKTIARELEWISMGSKDRHAMAQARLREYDALLQGIGDKDRRNNMAIPSGPRLGEKVVVADDISKGFGDRLLIEDLSFSLPRGGIVGVIGPNGAGKSTLFNMITGSEEPDSGTIELGETVEFASVHQMRDELDDDKSVFDNISGGNDLMYVGSQEINARAYVGAFGFKGGSQQQKAGTLSGGERNRLYLAKVLQKGANLILLDEPTNDLDVTTLRDLEDALLDFPGCVVVISHDRWFLNRIATHILAFEGDSQVMWFQGNYEDYEADKKKRLGDAADRPTRIKYKPLTR
ncbi:MAG: ATP-binding cassette domain-containing protein, partial [Myxococcales bacterium]|nr:ATP-binding cassette domain-containing protein [Myxococcales bacterium]